MKRTAAGPDDPVSANRTAALFQGRRRPASPKLGQPIAILHVRPLRLLVFLHLQIERNGGVVPGTLGGDGPGPVNALRRKGEAMYWVSYGWNESRGRASLSGQLRSEARRR
ncbi:hypothetical protein [Novosphingobium sp. PC22D]|uniref:hypothetical protein n=1 Tax=Novosphingobium sp. PC22D TaxID=1962403 RepID=UPI001145950D|nr:hypothetical protein [Novosphingobium sp. PC22D]